MIDNSLVMSCEELAACIDDENVRVVDCRFSLQEPESGQTQYLDNHIPGAVFADLDKDLAGPVRPASGRHPLPASNNFVATLGHLGISGDTHVVAYDQASGALAARLWWLLRWAGHERASLLDGGIARWESLGLPLENGQHEVAGARFDARFRPELVLDTDEILATMPDASAPRLVDARESQRFAGVTEPIDSVAGHIPGALNVPFAHSLNDDGTWKEPKELHGLWKDALGDRLGSPWGVMCGSGVTACHLVVSALLAGLPEPRVYVGSWSEWIRDPVRPLGTGVQGAPE